MRVFNAKFGGRRINSVERISRNWNFRFLINALPSSQRTFKSRRRFRCAFEFLRDFGNSAVSRVACSLNSMRIAFGSESDAFVFLRKSNPWAISVPASPQASSESPIRSGRDRSAQQRPSNLKMETQLKLNYFGIRSLCFRKTAERTDLSFQRQKTAPPCRLPTARRDHRLPAIVRQSPSPFSQVWKSFFSRCCGAARPW